MEKRNEFLDILKGVAIILVIIGHCIQYGSGSNYFSQEMYYSNGLFKFIYSFHMPIFMLISGYFYYFTIKKYSTKEIIKSRFTNLLLPIFAFAIIKYLLNVILKLHMFNGVVSYVIRFFIICFSNLWFLWAIFVCSLGVLLINKLFKDNIIIYGLIFIISFFIPDPIFLNLYKFMYPYFLTGYLINKYNKIGEVKSIVVNKKYFIITSVVYFLLLVLYNKNSYIYTTGHFILRDKAIFFLLNDIYRMIIGFIGSLFITMIMYFIYKKVKLNPLIYIGKKSLGIYAVSDIIFVCILPIVTDSLQGLNIAYTLLEIVIILVCCLGIVNLLEKNKLTKRIFLGRKNKCNKIKGSEKNEHQLVSSDIC